MDQATLERASGALLPDLVAIRRAIHSEPELGLENPATQQRVLDALDGLGFELTTGQGTTSVTADRGDPGGPTILLRADTDALPMVEESGEDFSSRIELGHGRFFELPTPVMGAEDFSYVLQQVPGAMAFLGACPTDITNSLQAPSCHSNRMRIDEEAMATAYLEQHA